ncbi:helix-turn-helix domain-containing protein [Aminobacter sp. UC22_36]|uniref:helix-turn-helix domain-containing protein n=1 Tax=Aminobacter sp. UC22_36 TaxID=3374549 RepID=UPI00375781BE
MAEVYSSMSLAKEWGCSRSTVHTIVTSGRLPAFSIGVGFNHIRITKQAVLEYLEKYGNPIDTDPDRRDLADTIAKWGEPYEGNVYFAATDGYVKIGYARRSNLLARLWDIQSMNPHPVVLLAILSGTISDEKALHRRFCRLRVRGEWFHRRGELLEFIASIPRKGVPSVTREPTTVPGR